MGDVVIPFVGQRTELSREDAIERYILLRLRTEDINRLDFLVKGLYHGTIHVPSDSPFRPADLKDTVRTAFLGWFASLTDRDGRTVYAFDPLFVLFPNQESWIATVQLECEACHAVLQQFRNNVAFHNRSDLAAHIKARRALREDDTFLDLESARNDFQRLMIEIISDELKAVPELPQKLAELGVLRHPAFANLFATVSTG